MMLNQIRDVLSPIGKCGHANDMAGELIHELSPQQASHYGLNGGLPQDGDEAGRTGSWQIGSNGLPCAASEQLNEPSLHTLRCMFQPIKQQCAALSEGHGSHTSLISAWEGVPHMTKNPQQQL
jgi:hypothetical protein|tara:strand:- start:1238 stop:1606 length:369 start_codon:yes stop_codon:yes gene_type:complete